MAGSSVPRPSGDDPPRPLKLYVGISAHLAVVAECDVPPTCFVCRKGFTADELVPSPANAAAPERRTSFVTSTRSPGSPASERSSRPRRRLPTPISSSSAWVPVMTLRSGQQDLASEH
jgi:hypothetical protein